MRDRSHSTLVKPYRRVLFKNKWKSYMHSELLRNLNGDLKKAYIFESSLEVYNETCRFFFFLLHRFLLCNFLV